MVGDYDAIYTHFKGFLGILYDDRLSVLEAGREARGELGSSLQLFVFLSKQSAHPSVPSRTRDLSRF
jgi:hypothetical protein